MALIGEFGAAVEAADPNQEPDQFTLCGELFTVTSGSVTIPFGRFAQLNQRLQADLSSADGKVKGEAAAQLMGGMLSLVQSLVIDSDKERLLDVAEEHDVDESVLGDILAAVMESRSGGRPTEQPSGSSGGLSPTGASSTATSPLGAVPPIQLDPRIQALQPVDKVILSLAAG